jgi:subtilisin family serine protease
MKLNSFWSCIFFILSIQAGTAQVNRYMVFFKDKTGTPFTTANPTQYLSQKSIERRIKQNISINELDLPVVQAYIQDLRNAGADVFYKTKWLNGALVQCDATLLPVLQGLAHVQSVILVAPNARLTASNGRLRSVSQKKGSHTTDEATGVQLKMLGIDQMHADGFRGEGVTIAVLDSGFPGVNTNAAFEGVRNDNRINLAVSYDFVFNTTNVFRYDSHGAQVFSTMAAYEEGEFIGGAFKADFQLYVTEDVGSEYRIEEYNWLFAAERADSAGADIISTSLGYTDFDDVSMNYQKSDLDGKTAVITRAAQFAADRGVLVICSAGNEGSKAWRTITPPADAIDVLAIANVAPDGQRSPGSSVGPSADARIKPDVAALGTHVSVITPGGSLGTASGTSLAAPLITSLSAGLWQRYPTLTNKELIDVLKQTASQATTPDNFVGYGIPNYKAVSNFFEFVPQANVFEVYPNPFADTLSLRPKSPEEIAGCRIQVLTIQGQLLKDEWVEFSWLKRTYPLNLSAVAPGLYFVRILLNERVYVFKTIKE